MLVPPLHGTLDLHDGLGVLVFASTLALWSLLSAVRAGGRRGRGAAPGVAAHAGEASPARAVRGESGQIAPTDRRDVAGGERA